jgi:hypothetical protein
MAEIVQIGQALAGAPVCAVQTTVVRCVALQPLTSGGTPDYLFTSGKPNRHNPAGVHCIYFAAEEATARAEYVRRLGNAARQPMGMYFAEVKLARVLDLTERKTCEALGMHGKQLSVSWIRAQKPTRAQLLGLAISQQHSISAIRYVSDAARAAGFAGVNLVIFRDALRKPDFVRILGPTKAPLEQWP